MELLNFIFQDLEHFIGTIILLRIIGGILQAIFRPAK